MVFYFTGTGNSLYVAKRLEDVWAVAYVQKYVHLVLWR